MSIEEILLDEATRVAISLERGVAILDVELLAFERRKIETEAKLKTAKLARTSLMAPVIPTRADRRLSLVI